MKKKAYWISAIIVIILIIAGVFAFNKHQQQENDVQSIRKTTVNSKNIPTFFFHGWGSSYHAEEDMTAAIKNAGVSNTIVRVNVNKNGQAKIIGKIAKNAKNPLVEVNYADNKLTNAHGSYTKYQGILFNRCKICQKCY